MVNLSYWLATSLAASAAGFRFAGRRRLQSPESLLPSDDPFYAVPHNIGSFSPGDIIDYREPPSEISSYGWVPAHLNKAYQILYRTTNSLQQPTATVLTVLIPPDADYDKVLSLQMAEDSTTINCGPSFTMQRPAQQSLLHGSNITQLQLLFAETALARKWIVIVPDYEGPDAAYTASKITAYSILDGIRAAKHSGSITGISSNPMVGLWGYSGGASATQVALHLQGSYAPELDIAGASMGGLPALSKASDIFLLNKGQSSALIPSALIGLSSQYPLLQRHIYSALKPQFRDLFYSPLHMCLQESSTILSFQDILGMFYDYALPGLAKELDATFQFENGRPSTTIKAPLYIYQTVHDNLADISKIDALVQGYCQQGIAVHYERANSPNLNHVSYGLVAIPNALLWMQDRLDGKPVSGGCVNHVDTTSRLGPALIAMFPKNIGDALAGYVNASG
ncbi:secretory lipase domain-containing protein [Trichoderma austrokoningii]